MACDILDVGCKIVEGITGLIVPYVFPLILLLVAIFILPKAGSKGVGLALIVIFLVILWYIGIPGLFPAIRTGFGY